MKKSFSLRWVWLHSRLLGAGMIRRLPLVRIMTISLSNRLRRATLRAMRSNPVPAKRPGSLAAVQRILGRVVAPNRMVFRRVR